MTILKKEKKIIFPHKVKALLRQIWRSKACFLAE